MGKLLLLLTFVGDLPTTPPMYKDAFSQSRIALMETKMVQSELHDLQNDTERWAYKHLGITKDELVYAAYAYPLFVGTISTKPFKNFQYRSKQGFTLRPDFEYKFQGEQIYSASILFVKEF